MQFMLHEAKLGKGMASTDVTDKIEEFLLKANSFHSTVKYQKQTETTFLDTIVYKGDRFLKESIIDVEKHFKPT